MPLREEISFCRICMGHCGVVLTLDEQDRLVGIRADREDPQTLGYACFKGLQSVEAHNSPDRILHPLKRMPDGSFVRIPLEQALDEIADKIRAILDESGPEAMAGYKGGGGYFTASAVLMLRDWLKALGSDKIFSSATIDQSAKTVAFGRIGLWPPGRTPFHRGDVFMLVGSNPLVSINPPFDTRNPTKRLKEAKARGMKLIVIDPRRTETAQFADLHLQPLPGEDAAVMAGLLHIILGEGWEDKEFCKRHVGDLDALRAALVPFTPDVVARRADVPAEKLFEVAELFAHRCKTGAAASSTGPDMGPHSNLAEHLLETLNVVCGRYLREGDPIDNPGVLAQRFPRPAQVVPAPRWWEHSYKSRIGGIGMLMGELPTGIMLDEILEPGGGRVRCLISHGGNPASAIPDKKRVVKAFNALDLLVSIEPFMTVTAQLSHYILPPKMQYERADLPFWLYETMVYPAEPYTRYSPELAKPPEGSELCDDWYVFWSLAKRLGLKMEYLGVPLDLENEPTTDDLLRIAARHAPVTFDEIKAHPRGLLAPGEPQFVGPADPDNPTRFTVMPDDVRDEIGALAAEKGKGGTFTHRLAVRRLRDMFNSMGRNLPKIRERVPYNRAFLNPDDMQAAGIGSDDWVEITSDHGRVRAIAEADPTLRRGVLSLSHGFGGLEEDDDAYLADGASTNLLIPMDRNRETINAMPWMTGIPVNVRRASSWPSNA
ncbi:MAG TPA: molybdopterin-dependent oxidoreductase [Alphaproteobacteria bacterium]|nr:molybdopterin-dependent oxidoreductase [Alphaproteobacteria bacterium]